jgi:broad specificity phosphatase PhoE
MITTVYLIRHGEVNNPGNIIYGRLPNFNLTEKGRKQLEKTGEFLKNKNIEEIYSSPLARTKESAAIIQKILGLKTIHISDQIIEVRSAYQGGKFSTLDKLQSEVYLKPLSPNDETIEQLALRMNNFINHISKLYVGRNIIALSHGDAIMALKTLIQYNSSDFIPFKTDHYVQHGEVFEVTSKDNTLQIKPVFKPVV